MGLFDMFKKKEEREYDPTNIRVIHLRENFLLDFESKTWQVTEAYEYDWGDNYLTYEYKLDCGSEIIYLSVENEDELELSVSRPIKLSSVEEDIERDIARDGKPPKRITYKGRPYFRDSESEGYFRNVKHDFNSAIPFRAWTFYDEDEMHYVYISQWDENEFEAAFGVVVEEYKFTNIIPANA